jgi:hypothetical protein
MAQTETLGDRTGTSIDEFEEMRQLITEMLKTTTEGERTVFTTGEVQNFTLDILSCVTRITERRELETSLAF